MALELNGSKQYPSRSELVQFGRLTCGLSKVSVEGVIEHVCGGVNQALEDMVSYAQMHPDFEAAMQKLTAVFRDGIVSLEVRKQRFDAM